MTSGPPDRRGRPLRRDAGIALVTIVVFVAAWWTASFRADARGGPAPAAGGVAVLPFRVAASDTALAYLREGMVDLLAAQLNVEGGPRALDARTTIAAWRRALPPGADALSVEAAAALARGLGADRLVLGGVVSTRAGLTLNARTYDADDGTLRTQVENVTGPADRLPALVDRLAAALLARTAGVDEPLGPLTGTSLPALRAYLAGQRLYRAGRYEAAAEHFRHAVDLDSSFVLAALGLAETTAWTGRGPGYELGLRLAWAGRDRVPPRVRDYVVAVVGPHGPGYSDFFHWDRDRLAAWETVVEGWPDRAEAWQGLGEQIFHRGALLGEADSEARARAAFERAIALDSTFAPAYTHLLETLLALAGDTARLRRLADHYFTRVAPGARNASLAAWTAAFTLGDHDWLERVRRNFDAMSTRELGFLLAQFQGVVPRLTDGRLPVEDIERALDALGRRSVSADDRRLLYVIRYRLALNMGRPARALRVTEEMLADDPTDSEPLVLRVWAALFSDGDTAVAEEAARALEPFAHRPASTDPAERLSQGIALCTVAHWRIARGDMDTAARDVARIRAVIAADRRPKVEIRLPICASSLDALVAAQDASPAAPARLAHLDSLLLAGVGHENWLEMGNIVSTRLHEARGEIAQALAAARRRRYASPWLSTMLLAEARLAARSGDRDDAASAYRHLLALRPDPGPTLRAEIERVRAELVQLAGEMPGR